jgi:DNA-binding CsgD family transcriptional regulator
MIFVNGRHGGASNEPAAALLGRHAEIDLTRQLIRDSVLHPRGLALEGEAGIGKTILWSAGVELARAAGATVLSTRGSQPDTDTSFAALSERQVADLVASGMTNREVAAQLFTSVRTVEGHLAAVYRKQGVRSRTELAKRAADVDGLEPVE